MIINVYQLPDNTPLFINGDIAYFSCPQCESLCTNKDYKNVYNVNCKECGFGINTQSILEFLKIEERMKMLMGGDIDGIE